MYLEKKIFLYTKQEFLFQIVIHKMHYDTE